MCLRRTLSSYVGRPPGGSHVAHLYSFILQLCWCASLVLVKRKTIDSKTMSKNVWRLVKVIHWWCPSVNNAVIDSFYIIWGCQMEARLGSWPWVARQKPGTKAQDFLWLPLRAAWESMIHVFLLGLKGDAPQRRCQKTDANWWKSDWSGTLSPEGIRVLNDSSSLPQKLNVQELPLLPLDGRWGSQVPRSSCCRRPGTSNLRHEPLCISKEPRRQTPVKDHYLGAPPRGD